MKNYLLKSIFVLIIAAALYSCSSDSNSDSVITKTKVKITAYKINSIPFTAPDGLGWDIGSNPDVYVGMTNGSSIVSISPTLTDFAPSQLPATYNFTTPYSIPHFSDNIGITVMDEDSGADNDDEIGTVNFVMSDYTTGPNKYPSSVVKSNGSTIISLNLIWED